MSQITLFLLGSPRLQRDSQPIEPDTRKAIALLAYLAVTGQAYSRDSLAALFYPDYDETHARAALRRTLSALNKALGEGGLRTSRDQVALNDSDLWVDVRELEALLSEVDRHRHGALEDCPDCLARLQRSTVLYRGDFLAGFTLRDSPGFDDWQFFQAETLRRLFATALERLAYSYRLRAEMDKAIEYARRWLALDPLLEDAHRELMRCYAQAGQRNAALRQYQECVRVLQKELGVEPLEETRRLYREILESRLQPGLPPRRPVEALPAETVEIVISTRTPAHPVIGRDRQIKALIDAYQKHAREGYLFGIEGEAGIGKTRLAEELLAWVEARGGLTVTAQCFAGESGLAYAPFVEVLRNMLNTAAGAHLDQLTPDRLSEVGRLAPSLRQRHPSLPEAPPLSTPGAQSLFYEGLRQALLLPGKSNAPAVLFLDDLHWADSASLDFLAYFVRRLQGNPLFVLVAWRDENLPVQERVRNLLAEVQRTGHGESLRLERLAEDDVIELAKLIAAPHGEITDRFSQRLFQETEGLPLFLVEYLQALLEQSNLESPTWPDETVWQLPQNARDLLHLRLSAADDLAQQLLAAAAVIGRSFDFETLSAASGRSEAEVMAGLESLLAHGLIAECGACDDPQQVRYDFSHDKLRTLVYDETSLMRRRLLHRRVAEALVEQARRFNDLDRQAGQLARHYQLAGQTAKAAGYFRQAGQHAQRLFANREALEHYRSALAAGHPDVSALNEAIGDIHTLFGEYHLALEAYRQAVVHAQGVEGPRLGHKIGNIHQRRGDWPEAIARYRVVLEGDPPPADALAAHILADWSLTEFQAGRPGAAQELAQQALQRACAADNPPALAQAYNLLGILERKRGQLDAARSSLGKSLDIARQAQAESSQAAALNNLALVMSELGELPAAIDYTQQALALCQRLGDRHRAAALHNNLADLYHQSGQPEKAMEHLKQAVIIFAEIGIDQNTDPDTSLGADFPALQPEIWKLTEW